MESGVNQMESGVNQMESCVHPTGGLLISILCFVNIMYCLFNLNTMFGEHNIPCNNFKCAVQ